MKIQILELRAVLLSILSLCVIAGCSGDKGPSRVDISGTATFAGAPIAFGEVTFIPDSKKGNSGPASSTSIKGGVFDTKKTGKGIVGGPTILRIIAFDGVPIPEAELPNGTPLFPEYEMRADFPSASE